MTALHRVKAYFGMVPADELDAYDGYGDRRYEDRYSDRYGDRYGDDRWSGRYEDRYPDRYAERSSDRYDERRYDDRRYDERSDDRRHRGSDPVDPEPLRTRGEERDELRPRTPRPRDPEPETADAEPASRPASRGRSWAANTGPNHTSVRSGSTSLGSRSSGPSAVVASSAAGSSSGSAPALAAVPSSASGDASGPGPSGLTRGALAVDDAPRRRESRETAAVSEPAEPSAPAEITTLQPKGYDEARVIGERYRDGIPVIMNLTDMDDVAAKRLVDFAAGLAFALRGSIEKVTNRVFLLSPPNVEVSAHDRRRLAENGFSGSS